MKGTFVWVYIHYATQDLNDSHFYHYFMGLKVWQFLEMARSSLTLLPSRDKICVPFLWMWAGLWMTALTKEYRMCVASKAGSPKAMQIPPCSLGHRLAPQAARLEKPHDGILIQNPRWA